MPRNTLLDSGYNVQCSIVHTGGHAAISQLCFGVKCTVLLSSPPNSLCIFAKAHTHWPEPLCLLLERRAGRLVIGQIPQLSHPSVSPHLRHAENTISATMAVISFEFVVLVMHDTGRGLSQLYRSRRVSAARRCH